MKVIDTMRMFKNNFPFLFGRKKLLMLGYCMFFSIYSVQAQVYPLHKNEIYLLTGSALFAATGEFLYSKKKVPVPAHVINLHASEINKFDLIATNYYSKSAANVSDVFALGCAASPLFFLLNKKIFSERKNILYLYSETMFITMAEIQIVKALIYRKRPFLYNENILTEKKLNKDAWASFFSGHTAISSAGTFMAAKIYCDHNPNSKIKPLIWSAAFLLPATTGYLRVRAGKHFPSDVIVGFIVGAVNGVLIPELRKNKSKN